MKTYLAIKSNLSKNTNPLTLIRLNRKIVIPTVFYGYELWNTLKHTDLEVPKKFQHFVIKNIQDLTNVNQIGYTWKHARHASYHLVKLTKEKYCFSENYANWTATKAIFLKRLYDFIQNNGKKKKSQDWWRTNTKF